MEQTTQTYSVKWETLSLRSRVSMWVSGIVEAISSFPSKEFPRITPQVKKRRQHVKQQNNAKAFKQTRSKQLTTRKK